MKLVTICSVVMLLLSGMAYSAQEKHVEQVKYATTNKGVKVKATEMCYDGITYVTFNLPGSSSTSIKIDGKTGLVISCGNPEVPMENYVDKTVCPMDVKACEDGSYVARQKPNCDFAKCKSGDVSEKKAPSETESN